MIDPDLKPVFVEVPFLLFMDAKAHSIDSFFQTPEETRHHLLFRISQPHESVGFMHPLVTCR